jgi:hypothetical protein
MGQIAPAVYTQTITIQYTHFQWNRVSHQNKSNDRAKNMSAAMTSDSSFIRVESRA